ncbi:MAG: hypothetical protein JO157_09615 [Acetobacteraceae bacterium]|nr:hypothetical protein [Acetobacteraceae bacterium]
MPELRFPWATEPAVPAEEERGPALPKVPVPPKRRGRRPGRVRRAIASDAAPPWTYHRLAVSGPASEVASFAEAARGPGIVPWRLDLDAVEEGVFALAVSQPPATRSLSVEGCRVLARQFRDRVAAHHAKAAALIAEERSLACPFDLHALLPVPETVLQLGPAHPGALAWLREHWGTTDRLRQVVAKERPGVGRRLPCGFSAVGYGFFTAAGEVPCPALAQLGARWLGLHFRLRQPATD